MHLHRDGTMGVVGAHDEGRHDFPEPEEATTLLTMQARNARCTECFNQP